ncbi:MAG: LamG domain-containing protein [Myxococcota bacterium]|nr:LamG domain-containing protein [Myxococcota bacterium]
MNALGSNQSIISAGYNGGESQWTMKVTTGPGNVSFHRYDGSFHGAETPSTLAVGEWAHVAGVYDGANWRIYVDGEFEATYADVTGITGTPQHVYIGAITSPFEDIQNFDGRIRDVRVYEREPDEDEITVVSGGSLNEPPVADPLSISVDEDGAVAISLGGTDPDGGDAVEKFRIDSLPSGSAGVLTLDGNPEPFQLATALAVMSRACRRAPCPAWRSAARWRSRNGGCSGDPECGSIALRS